MLRRGVCLAVLLGLAAPTGAGAHEPVAGAVGPVALPPTAAALLAGRAVTTADPIAPTTPSKVVDGRDVTTFASGPCTGAARQAWPDGGDHDHLDITQHRFACGMQQIGFLSLKEELGAREDVILGEMDVKNGIAAVAVTYPEAGALFFDVRDPRNPRFLSWWRGGECEGLVFDINCGAFVDLSADARTAFISTQNTSVIPGSAPPPGTAPTTIPGVYAVDIADPRRPRLTDVFPVLNLAGVHTARSHVIPGKGEYVFTNTISAQGLTNAAVDILRLDRSGGAARLSKVGSIELDELHDTFIQQDPLDGRTYLYIASGFSSGFLVYDVTDPAAPKLKAEWDLTPQCGEDWYAHTMDVVVRGGRRYVTMPAEMISSFGEQSAEDQAEGCGELVGNGDVPGPLWIVDATDFSKLGPAEPVGADDEPALAAASKAALVATWTNPADRAGGNLSFSPHNQQIVGDKILLSHYHGGVYVLDASEAFAGRRVRPTELGFMTPHASETRPIFEPAVQPLMPFLATFPAVRPEIWDAYAYRGVVYAADQRGGFYALEEAPTAAPAAAPAKGRPKVALSLTRARAARRTTCARQPLQARLTGPGVRAVRSVTFLAGKRRLAVDRRRPYTTRTTRRSLGRARTLTARVTFSDGTTQRLTRRVRRCG
ncbi:MAG TPA: hypothetical protein VD931_18135 [Baekduia sp.]|nr:hypothetical protein [Baekduia sp.]